MFYSPLRYPGGKSSLASLFDRIIIKNNLENVTYVEPYAGGAGASLSLLMCNKVGQIIINDLDKAIYSFWKSAIFNSDKFIEKINSTSVDIKQWYKQKKNYRDKNSSELDLGFATFFLNRTNRSGIIEGGPIGGLGQKGKWKIDARFNKNNLIERIRKIALYKNKIKVSRFDGIDLIKRIKKINNVFVYLDPPYYEKGSSLYLNHYIDKDHRKLSNFLNSNLDLNWLLTYDDVSSIRNLYKDRRMKEFPINYSAHTKKVGSEIMIFSDSLIN